MARYAYDYQGIPARLRYDNGMDPNFRGGYRGMRMTGGDWQAAYGRHRLHHAGDLETAGGFYGRGLRGEYPRMRERLPEETAGGGTRDRRYDRDLLRQFNANSVRLRGEGRGSEERGAEGREVDRPRRQRGGNEFGYTNRGLSESGYSQGWARGPMRGAPNRAPDRAR